MTLNPGRLEVSLFNNACDGDQGTVEIVKHFLDAKADVNYKTNSDRTPLSQACSVDNMLNPELVQLLIDHKAQAGIYKGLETATGNRETREDVKEARGWTPAQVKDAQDRADKVIAALKKAIEAGEAEAKAMEAAEAANSK